MNSEGILMMKCMKFLGTFAALALIAGTADASTITYEYQTTLSLASGTDALGLNGAFLNIQVDVDSSALYVNRFGLPAVIMNNDATVTVSGSSNASNNGTFALPQLAFYASFAGLFADPAGAAATVTLPVGGTLTLQVNTFATATGAAEAIGNTVNILDFAPATSEDLQFGASNGDVYSQINPIVIATTLTPEPASVTLVLASLVGLGFMRRSRIR
jgi:hypothetical protein